MDTWWFETLPDEERKKGEPFRTPRFHRTMSQWVEMITEARLAIEQFVEPCASVELADAEPVVADTRIVPMSLLIRLRKLICSVAGNRTNDGFLEGCSARTVRPVVARTLAPL